MSLYENNIMFPSTLKPKAIFSFGINLLFAGCLLSSPVTAQISLIAPTKAPDSVSSPSDLTNSETGLEQEPLNASQLSQAIQENIDEETRQLATTDKEKYEQSIAELEQQASQNVYSDDLAQAYLGLATSLVTLSQYEEASVAFDKALQTIRINNGLNSLQQIPVLEELASANEAQGKWEDVDDTTHLLFHIARRNYPVGDERRVDALEKLRNWKFKKALDVNLEGLNNDIPDIVQIYETELRLLASVDDYKGKNFHQAKLHLGEASSKLQLAQQILKNPLSEYGPTMRTTTTRRQCFMVRLRNGGVGQFCEMVEVPNMDNYMETQNSRARLVERNLAGIRDALRETYLLLQTDEEPELRDYLLTEMNEVTQAYNSFVNEKSL